MPSFLYSMGILYILYTIIAICIIHNLTQDNLCILYLAQDLQMCYNIDTERGDVMPTISMFYGILIRMYYEDHQPPHFHAVYGDEKASYNFNGDVLNGKLPPKQHKLVVAWIEIHKEDLQANWQLACDGEQFFKIEPLK